LNTAQEKTDRTGTEPSAFWHACVSSGRGFPLLTTKKVNFKLIVSGVAVFSSGATRAFARFSQQYHIWDRVAFKAYLIAKQTTGSKNAGSDEWNAE